MKESTPPGAAGMRITRRGFLWVAALATGGLAVGIGAPRVMRAVRDRTPAPPLGPQGWIEIAPDGGIRLYCNATEMGQGAWSALAQGVAEELDADFARVTVAMAPVERPFFAPNDYQTGGSNSVRGQFATMRRLGAAARSVLVQAAASRWRVSPSECAVTGGVIEHAATGRRLAFGEVADDASRLSPPAEPSLKPPAQWRIIGRPVRRAEVPSKVDGSAVYGTDIRLPGLRFAAIAHCPVAGGRLVSVDDKPALAVAGVERVARLEDAVAVFASGTWPALQGLSRLEPRWDAGAHAAESTAAVREALTSALAGDRLEPHQGDDSTNRRAEEARAILREPGDHFEATYEAPYLAHAPIEPTNATAWWHDDRLEIWAPTQNQGILRRRIADRLGIGTDRVVVHTPLVGGRFGRGLEIDYAIEAARFAKDASFPIQVLWSREEDFSRDYFRTAAAARLRAAPGGDTGLRALEVRVAHASASPGVAGLATMPYLVPVSALRTSLARGIRTGPWRAVDMSQNIFFRESFIDECAAHAKRDPLDLRLALLPAGSRSRRVLEAVAKLARWGERHAYGRHLGLAFTDGWGSFCAIVAEAVVESGHVRIAKCYAAVDCGTTVNPSSAAAQVEGGIAMALSAALLEEVTVKEGRVVSSSYSNYPILRFPHSPAIEVAFLESPDAAFGGLGELAVPPTAPAVANALFAATGVRVRRLPIKGDARLKLAAG